MITDPVLLRIGEAVQLNHRGEREAARREFSAIWEEIGGEQGDPLVRCTLAHAMADAQDDVREELVWDLRALVAAELITDQQLAEAGVPLPVAGLYPSLHLNLSECYRRLGDLDLAREHLQAARTTVAGLPDDEYGQLIRRGLEQVAERLGTAAVRRAGRRHRGPSPPRRPLGRRRRREPIRRWATQRRRTPSARPRLVAADPRGRRAADEYGVGRRPGSWGSCFSRRGEVRREVFGRRTSVGMIFPRLLALPRRSITSVISPRYRRPGVDADVDCAPG
jgi:hypothetical protein